MSRMYDQNGLPKSYHLESQLTPKDIEMIQTAYRDAQYESDRHRSWDDSGQEARSRMRTLKALFGGALFIDIDSENRPCPHRIRVCNGRYDCRLAREEKQRRGIKTFYDTECRWMGINAPCTECPEHERHDKNKP